jgi:anthranilate synthase component I
VADYWSSAKFNPITPLLQDSISPSRNEFHDFAKRGNLVPVIVDLVADVETPVSAFAKIDNGEPCFLFESAERNEELGRFSFIGFDPLVIFNSAACEGDPLTQLQQALEQFKFVAPADVPHFIGGAVGYIGYDVVRFFEPTVPIHTRDDLKIPEMIFMIPRMLVVFDHRFRRLRLICNAHIEKNASADQAYDRAVANLENAAAKLGQQRALPPIDAKPPSTLPSPSSNTIRAEFESMVAKAKESIAAGDSGTPRPTCFVCGSILSSQSLGVHPKFICGSATESPNFGRLPEPIRAEEIQPKTNSWPSS